MSPLIRFTHDHVTSCGNVYLGSARRGAGSAVGAGESLPRWTRRPSPGGAGGLRFLCSQKPCTLRKQCSCMTRAATFSPRNICGNTEAFLAVPVIPEKYTRRRFPFHLNDARTACCPARFFMFVFISFHSLSPINMSMQSSMPFYYSLLQ